MEVNMPKKTDVDLTEKMHKDNIKRISLTLIKPIEKIEVEEDAMDIFNYKEGIVDYSFMDDFLKIKTHYKRISTTTELQ
jgi:hypothetical protein